MQLKLYESQPFLFDAEEIEISYSSFLHQFAEKYEYRKYSDDSYDDFFSKLREMEDRHSYIPLAVRCKEFFYDDKIRFMFYDLCNDCLLGCYTALTSVIENIYENNESIMVAREFLDEKHFLQEKGFTEFKDKGSLIDATLTLTEKGKKFFLGEDYDLYLKKDIDKRLKNPEDIPAKKLFYNEENGKQIDEVTKALSQSKYKAIQKRLSEKALPKGIAIILHGAPGCGKTETVYQLAKKTGRAIMQVDISNTKSCWFGESEKMIKQVFSDYKEVCKKSEKEKNGHTPILFINECDAIFSKRKDISASNSQQVENTIQNIILEEMEKLEGILIATTNLIDNLDPAFERRFLFKIRFENPSLEAKEAIWKNRFKWITQGQAQDLARNYNFSGGEIENIVRKAEMKEIVSGSRPLFSDIEDMCRVEKITSNTTNKPLGFAI
ncbi:MAG: ATP-binding protein [Treponema sp.]|nr:ATP-binding protein [Treponema sp.]